MSDLETRSNRHNAALQALARLTQFPELLDFVAGEDGFGVLNRKGVTADRIGPIARPVLGALVNALDNVEVRRGPVYTRWSGVLGRLRVRVCLPTGVVLPADVPEASYADLQQHPEPLIRAIRALGALANTSKFAVDPNGVRPGLTVYSGLWSGAQKAVGAALIGCLADAKQSPWTSGGVDYVTVSGTVGESLPVRVVLTPEDRVCLAAIPMAVPPAEPVVPQVDPLAELHAAYAALHAEGASSNDVEQWLDDYLTRRGFTTVLYA